MTRASEFEPEISETHTKTSWWYLHVLTAQCWTKRSTLAVTMSYIWTRDNFGYSGYSKELPENNTVITE